MNPYPNGMGHAPRASQLSGATAFSSASSTLLSSMSSSGTLVPPQSGGPVLATNNIINQKADASKSLYQICVNLRQRLRQVPGFEQHLIDSDDEDEGGDMEMDPMSSLWRCLRKGYPLMTIYNCLQPAAPLQIVEGTVAARNIPKSAAFKFVQACLTELKFEECFVLTDLFGDDTTGFVKVSLVLFLSHQGYMRRIA
jgi:cell division control protein 24